MSEATAERIDRLLDAIELIKDNQREAALPLLRLLIQEDKDYEEAWLWMSVAVDSIDQTVVCLENVLRINPKNLQASGALHRLRETEMLREKKRSTLRFYRDMSFALMWVLVIFLLYAVFFSMFSQGSGA